VNAARHGLTMDKTLFTHLVGELARRGKGKRETGAFLLARAGHPQGGSRRPRIVAVAYYDDLDPGCLTGGITFTADGYTALAALCRRDGLRVVADIHTHPGRNVRQSPTDAAYPMRAMTGHIALIAPRYASGVTSPADLGVHVLQAAGQWQSAYGPEAARIVQLTSARSAATRLQAVARWLRSLIPTRRT
jgi:hypothetical protein